MACVIRITSIVGLHFKEHVSLYNYINAETIVEGTIKFANVGTAAVLNNWKKKVIFKRYA